MGGRGKQSATFNRGTLVPLFPGHFVDMERFIQRFSEAGGVTTTVMPSREEESMFDHRASHI